jgi:hypothetical protein
MPLLDAAYSIFRRRLLLLLYFRIDFSFNLCGHPATYPISNVKIWEESYNGVPEIVKAVSEYRYLCPRMSFAPLSVYGLGHNSGHPKGVFEHRVAFQIQDGHP